MFVTVSTLQEERAELMALKETLQKYIRQLEQTNDDLERGKRWARLHGTNIGERERERDVNCTISLPQGHHVITWRLRNEIKSGKYLIEARKCRARHVSCPLLIFLTALGIWKKCNFGEWARRKAEVERDVPETQRWSQRYIHYILQDELCTFSNKPVSPTRL